MIALKTNKPQITVKTISLVASGEDRMGLQGLQSLVPRQRSLHELSGSSLKNPIARLCLLDLTQNSPSKSFFFPFSESALLKTISGNCSTLQLT